MARLVITLLGAFRVFLDGQPLPPFRSRKVVALLAYLAAEPDRPHPRSVLAGLLWPESSDRDALRSLSGALADVRRVIGDREADVPLLAIGRDALQLCPSPSCWSDLGEFLSCLERAQAPGEHLDLLRRAVDLYRGPFLEGLAVDSASYEEWLLFRREECQQKALQALRRLGQYHAGRREWEDAVGYARRQLALDPWDEQAHRQVMRALALGGRRGAALEHYDACRKAFADGLGVDPEPETQALFQAILAGTLSETGPPAPVDVVPSPAPTPAPGPSDEPALSADESGAEEPWPGFVGREREMDRLAGFLGAALEGRAQVAFVIGEPGSGKTLLLREFARRAITAHQDLVVAQGAANAHTGIGDPYLPFADVLHVLTGEGWAAMPRGAVGRELRRRLRALVSRSVPALLHLGPDLIGTMASADDLSAVACSLGPEGEPWLESLRDLERRRAAQAPSPNALQTDLFEQYTRVLRALAREQPLLLMLDDLQWADGGTLGLLFHLARRLGECPVLVLGAYRPGDVAQGRGDARHPLEAVVGELRSAAGDIIVDLGQAQTRAFCDGVVDSEANSLGEGFRQALYARTGGHALFTVEMLRALRERGVLRADESGVWVEGVASDWDVLPQRVGSVIDEQFGRLLEPWRRALEAASVQGEEFVAEVAAAAGGIDEDELLALLSGPLYRRHHLVAPTSRVRVGEHSLTRFRFRHYLYHSYLYNSLDGVLRAGLHERTGQALASRYGDDTAAIAVQLARHYEEAGLVGAAIGYLRQAGERALGMCAYEEAVYLLRRGLELLGTLPDAPDRPFRELRLLNPLRVALEVLRGPTALETVEARQHAELLIQRTGESPPIPETRAHVVGSYMGWATYRWALRAWEDHLRQALADEDGLAVMRAYYECGLVLEHLGELVNARSHYESSLQAYDPRQQQSRMLTLYGADLGILCRGRLASLLSILGFPDRAWQEMQATVAQAEALGHGRTLVACLRQACALDHLLHGDPDAVSRWLERLDAVPSERELPGQRHWMRLHRGWVHALTGAYDEGLAEMQACLPIEDLLRAGDLSGRPEYLANMAEVCADASRIDAGLRAVDEALEQVQATWAVVFEPRLHLLRGELLRTRGAAVDAARAEESLRQALTAARAQGARWWELRAGACLGRLLASQGRGREAQEVLAEAMQWFGEGYDTPALREARSLLADLVAGGVQEVDVVGRPEGAAYVLAPQPPTVTYGTTWQNWLMEHAARVVPHARYLAASLGPFEEQTGIRVEHHRTNHSFPPTEDNLGKGIDCDCVEFIASSAPLELARRGRLVDLNTALDPETLRSRIDQRWIDWSTVDGPEGPVLAGLYNMVFIRHLIWYPKAAFDAAGYQVPTTWGELLALSSQMVRDGRTPWAIETGGWGPEVGGNSVASWIEDMLRRTTSYEECEQWVRGELPCQSPQVRRAVELMGEILFTPGYTYGGRGALNALRLGTDLASLLFTDPPTCWLARLPGWVSPQYFPEWAEFGKDYAFFNMPPIDPAYGAPVVLEGHFVGMLHDRPEARALMDYMTTGVATDTWIRAAEGTEGDVWLSPFKDAGWGPHTHPRCLAMMELLNNATQICCSGIDRMPPRDRDALGWNAQYVAGTLDLDTLLQRMDEMWSRVRDRRMAGA